MNIDLTGAQVKATLEQQWQPAGASRPFLRLGTSEGFTSTYDASKPLGSRITGMWLDGAAIQPATVYSVTVNSFLASGGDNFTALAGGTGKQDTGQTDLEGMVDYMAAFASGAPLAVDYAQHQVGVSFPAAAPASYAPGAHVTFALSSLSMTDPLDTRDTSVTVKPGARRWRPSRSPRRCAPRRTPTATTMPARLRLTWSSQPGHRPGRPMVVEGAMIGTVTRVPVTIASVVTPTPTPTPTPVATTVTGSAASFTYGTAGSLALTVSPGTASGTVTVTEGATALGTATITNGTGTLALAAKALQPGTHTLTLAYAGNATHKASTSTVAVRVTKANPKVKIKVDKAITKGKGTRAVVKVSAPDGVKVKGKVKLVIKGTDKEFKAKIVDGKAVFDLPKFTKAGTFTLRAAYSGSDLLTKADKLVKVTVTK